jgi:hypothetical protein
LWSENIGKADDRKIVYPNYRPNRTRVQTVKTYPSFPHDETPGWLS